VQPIDLDEVRRAAPDALHKILDRGYQGFLEVLVFSSIWSAASMAALGLFTGHVLDLSLDLRPSLLLLASAVFVYTVDRLADIRTDGIPDAWKAQFFRGRSVFALLFGCGAITAGLLWNAPPATRWVFLTYMTIGIAYGLPIIRLPGKAKWMRLKDIPLLKSWLVGGAISVGVVGLPLSWAGVDRLTMDGWFLFVFVFVFCTTNAHVFDIRDIESDREAGVRTMPVVLGVEQTKYAMIGMNLAMLALMMWGWLDGITGPHPEIIICSALAVLYVWRIRIDTPRDMYGILVDGCSYLPALLAVIHDGVLKNLP
jgi:4-hydroxybenzoate polyprenyltransferase